MSGLSFLIENHKKVEVDESYLQKCKAEEQEKQNELILNPGPSRVLSSKELKVNKNFMPSIRKPISPKSYNLKEFSITKSEQSDPNQQLFKINMRVDALDENQKRLEHRFSKEFTNLHNAVFSKKNQYSELMAELNSIKNDISESKKVIGHVLNDITAKGK